MKLFIASEKTPDRNPETGQIAGLVIKKGLLFRPDLQTKNMVSASEGYGILIEHHNFFVNKFTLRRS
jgi:hypothetical protein